MTARRASGRSDFSPALIIFDKDGTLIDFDAMWGGWLTQLTQRLETATRLPISARLFAAIGFDPATNHVAPNGPLAIATMAELRALTVDVLLAAGLPRVTATAAVESAWIVPDPVALARPLADLPLLFRTLRTQNIKLAVATTDDHAPTTATLAALGIAPFVDAVIGGDDGVPVKPAPEMITTLCRSLGIVAARAAMVGDTIADLQMGRAAGAGLVIGVLSGVGTADVLAPFADRLIPSVADLLP